MMIDGSTREAEVEAGAGATIKVEVGIERESGDLVIRSGEDKTEAEMTTETITDKTEEIETEIGISFGII